MPTVEVNGIPIFYFEYRVRGGAVPPVLLIHGAGGQHAHWPPQVRRLPGVQTFAPDLPGHGRSGGQARTRLSGTAGDLLAFMDAIGVDRFVAVGHSMGGGVALELALRAAERVAGLGLLGTGATLPINTRLLAQVDEDFDAAVDFVIGHQYGPGVDPKVARVGRRQLKETGPASFGADMRACQAYDVTDRLGEIAAPALVIAGEEDRMVRPTISEALAAELPNAQFVLVEDTGHMLPAEAPSEVAAVLGGWLAEQLGG